MDGQKSGCLVRRVQSTINIVDTSNNNKEESSTPLVASVVDDQHDSNPDVDIKTCVFYVSEDEDNVQDHHGGDEGLVKSSTNNQEQKIRRAIVKPCRRSRKSKLELLNFSAEESAVTENEKPKSPILLPWKKSFESSPVNMVSIF